MRLGDHGSDSRNISRSTFEITGTGDKVALEEIVRKNTYGMDVLSADYVNQDGKWKCSLIVKSENGIPGSMFNPNRVNELILFEAKKDDRGLCSFGNVELKGDPCAFGDV